MELVLRTAFSAYVCQLQELNSHISSLLLVPFFSGVFLWIFHNFRLQYILAPLYTYASNNYLPCQHKEKGQLVGEMQRRNMTKILAILQPCNKQSKVSNENAAQSRWGSREVLT